jgi:alkyldihydroxyacetonephosphate synthase
VHRSQATAVFESFEDGLAAVRGVVQSGLLPANCRLLDPVEATLNGAGTQTTLVLGFESAEHPQRELLDAALELVRKAKGTVSDGPHHRAGDSSGTSSGGAADWRSSFLAGPYLRDALVRLGMVVETVETAITWDRVEDLVTDVRDALVQARPDLVHEPIVSVRATHAYRDGVAPYFTIIVPGTRGSEVAAWDDLKAAAGDVLVASGATITHHHAVGRDHAPWLDRQHPQPFRRALAAAKQELDPGGILNPGVLGLEGRPFPGP